MTGGRDNGHDEIAEKAPYWTSEVVNTRLSEAFVGEQRAAAALLLAGLVGEDPADPEHSDEASCRLMLDALKVSGGDLMKLRLWVEAAHLDPRDLIAAAEYPRQLGGESERAAQADFEDYLGWLHRG